MKRKTNRILSLLLALIMCVGVLSACGGDTAGKDDPPAPPPRPTAIRHPMPSSPPAPIYPRKSP